MKVKQTKPAPAKDKPLEVEALNRVEARRYMAFRRERDPKGSVRELVGRHGELGSAVSYHAFIDKDHDCEVTTLDIMAALAGKGAGLITSSLNPVNAALYGRAAAKLARNRSGQGAGDGDIVCRRFVPIDLDADRPSGVPSTDEKHEAALARQREAGPFRRNG